MSNSKFDLIFYEVELVTQNKNFYKYFRVSNSKCDTSLPNSVSQLDFVTREFRTFELVTSTRLICIDLVRA